MKYRIENMTCGGCARSVAKVIQTVDPHADVVTDVASRTVEIRSSKPDEAFAPALAAAGYRAAEAVGGTA